MQSGGRQARGSPLGVQPADSASAAPQHGAASSWGRGAAQAGPNASAPARHRLRAPTPQPTGRRASAWVYLQHSSRGQREVGSHGQPTTRLALGGVRHSVLPSLQLEAPAPPPTGLPARPPPALLFPARPSSLLCPPLTRNCSPRAQRRRPPSPPRAAPAGACAQRAGGAERGSPHFQIRLAPLGVHAMQQGCASSAARTACIV